MDYRAAIRILNSRGNEVHGIHLGLSRIRAMMTSLGNPHLQAPVIHIAGTNGKGSVAAMTESILRHAGLKTGLYTSPHLVRLEERIRINGRNITRGAFAASADPVLACESALLSSGAIQRPLTYFEFLTACAFVHFARSRIEVAIVEVGLGGALDATNVVEPAVAVITGVARDHQNILGNSIAGIAREKAGVVKAGITVLSGCTIGAAQRIVRQRARECEARLLELDRELRARIVSEKAGLCTIELTTPLRRYSSLRLPLAGRHQARNATLAIAAVEQVVGDYLGPGDIRRGLSAAVWPGRMQEFEKPRRTILDGAHNPEGSAILADHLSRIEAREIHLVFSAMKDKEIGSMGRKLFPLAKAIHLAPLQNERAALPSDVASIHQKFKRRLRQYRGSHEALQAAWAECPPGGIVVVTGSLYLVGEVLPLILRRQSTPGSKGTRRR